MFRKLGSFILLLGVGACATKYVPPTSLETTAQINYEASGGAALGYTSSLYIQKKPSAGKCYSSGELVAWVNRGNPIGGATDNPKNVPFDARSTANFCINFAPANVGGQRACNSHVSFDPVVGKIYTITASWSSESCAVHLSEGDDRRAVAFYVK